ncbi:MAG: HWE histidine kinase domain-containing protein [Pseudomonadota bacterium]
MLVENSPQQFPAAPERAIAAEADCTEERSRNAQIINHLATFALMLDQRGRLSAMDPRLADRLGLAQEAWRGTPVWQLPLFAREPTAQSALMGVILEGERGRRTAQFETVIDPPGAQPIPLLWHIGAVHDRHHRLSEFVLSAKDITGQEKVRRALARSNALLDSALNAGRLGVYEFYPATEDVFWSGTLRKIWGLDPSEQPTASTIFDLIHPDDRGPHFADLQKAMTPPGPGLHTMDLRFWHRPSQSYRWIHTDGEVTFRNGQPERIIGVVIDITEKRRSEEQREILIHELNHRVKNIFGILHGMVGMTARTSDTPDAMADALRARISSMARAHDIIRPAITLEDIRRPSVDMKDLIEAVVRPHISEEHTLILDGTPFDLRAHGTTSLALLLHELTTNASKYGALRNDGVTQGQLAIGWRRQADRFQLHWIETGGPPVSSVGSAGFGSKLIELTVRQNLKGTVDRRWGADGLTVHIDVPLKRVSA